MTTPQQQNGIGRRLVRYFVAGAFTVLPLLLTVATISWIVNFLAGIVGPKTFLGDLFRRVGIQFVTNPTVAYILGWVGLAAVIFLVGFLVESGLRELIKKISNAILRRIPLVGKVYETSQQLVDMIDTGGDDKLKGMSVVYCTFGEKGGVGVLALLPTREIITIGGQQFHVVLVPQSPVPFGGGLLFMPVESVEHVAMSVDALMSVYVSMGVVAPEKMRTLFADGS